MSSAHRSPALDDIIEPEPQIDRMEVAGVVLARDIRAELIYIKIGNA